eukprot:GGOE01042396.1.p1 GENE.GGOE01042396.1~~GGOE01042396.1.p1  ORF type:complete len:676 (+),score=180.89 GGOE01042396.1:27-2030(+)
MSADELEVRLLALRATPGGGNCWALWTGTAVVLLLLLFLCPHPLDPALTVNLVSAPSRPHLAACYCSSPAMAQRLPLTRFRGPMHLRAVPSASDADSTAEEDVPPGSFEAFGLHPAVIRGLRRMHFRIPSDVQAAAIPHVMAKANVAVQSHTGSGKTAVFLLPMLTEMLDLVEAGRPSGDHVTHLVVAPSQELCMQIVHTAEALLGFEQRWMLQQLIGGANMERQKEAMLQKRPLLIVGTPGRLVAMLGTALGIHHVQLVALDEADALAEQAFQADMERIMQHVGKKVPGGPRVLLTSASLTDSMLARMRELWHLPEMCKVLATSSQLRLAEKMRVAMSPTLTHLYVMAEPRTKVDTLRRVLVALAVPKALVFMNEAKRLKDTLFRLTGLSSAFKVAILHSDLPKSAKRTAIQGFRQGEVEVLVVTDVLARGMDLDCDAVINLEVPEDALTYAHRAGRTGRMGREGAVVTIVCPFETIRFGRLETSLNISIPQYSAFGGELVDPTEVPQKSTASPPKSRAEPTQSQPPKPMPRTKSPANKAQGKPQAKAKPKSDLSRLWDSLKQMVVKEAPATPDPVDTIDDVKQRRRARQQDIRSRKAQQKRDATPWLWRERLSPEQQQALEVKAQRRAEAKRRALASAGVQLEDHHVPEAPSDATDDPPAIAPLP